jgi:N6-adenosine-specific RNA methylase IME4
LQKRLELMFPNANRCELFARRALPGWSCLGDGIDGLEISAAIRAFIAL